MSFTAQPKGECQEPGHCGAVCHCGEMVKGHGTAGGSHMAVPMECGGCDPLLRCDGCGETVASAYSHQHECAKESSRIQSAP